MERSPIPCKTILRGGVVLILLGLVSGCGCSLSLKSNDGYAEDIQSYFDAIQKDEPNSIQTIDQAVEEKRIDSETALVYKIYAIFGDDRLPEEFQSTVPTRNGTPLVREMNRRWDSLSAQTKEILEPYRLRPDEEGSWVNQRFGIDNQNEQAGIVPRAHANRPSAYTDFFVSADGKVKIWYPSVSGVMRNIDAPGTMTVDAATGKEMAKRITKYLDDDEIISDFEDLMRRSLMSDGTKGGDSKYDIYVAPCGSDYAVTFSETATPTPSYIIMNYGIGLQRDNILKTTLAHEIFHAFQYTYDYDDVKDNWWGEATSVWSEDYIYPHVNSEHGWLSKFIHHPATQADKESPPSDHHYAAYILAYFITDQFGDDFMRKSWEYCDGKKCIDGIDEHIDGGIKKQWKEFTLWNYNKEPAKYYMDMGPFPPLSSADSSVAEDVFISEGITEIDVDSIKPLAADIATATNSLPDETEVQSLTFTDLQNITSQYDTAGIKAVIYYKNGEKEIEDWTERQKRTFCIENKDEDFDKVVLIFSNGEKEKEISATQLKVESRNNCFFIDEKAARTAVVHFPYYDGGMRIVDINTSIDTLADGQTAKDASKKVQYGYQTEWSVKYEFEQIKDAFSFSCQGSSINYEKGWTTRAAGYLTFNLDPNSDGYRSDTFPIDMQYGELHPNGPYEDVPSVNAQCVGLQIGASKIDLSNYKGVTKGIYTGKITEMTPGGAKIEIPNCCLYHSCTTQQGAPFQDMSAPVILEIKRKGS